MVPSRANCRAAGPALLPPIRPPPHSWPIYFREPHAQHYAGQAHGTIPPEHAASRWESCHFPAELPSGSPPPDRQRVGPTEHLLAMAAVPADRASARGRRAAKLRTARLLGALDAAELIEHRQRWEGHFLAELPAAAVDLRPRLDRQRPPAGATRKAGLSSPAKRARPEHAVSALGRCYVRDRRSWAFIWSSIGSHLLREFYGKPDTSMPLVTSLDK